MLRKLIIIFFTTLFFQSVNIFGIDIYHPGAGLECFKGFNEIEKTFTDTNGLNIICGNSPYIFLSSGSRRLDSSRYFIMRFKIFVSKKTRVSITFWSDIDNWFNHCGQSDDIILNRGWNNLDIDLDKLRFYWNGKLTKEGWGGTADSVDRFKFGFSAYDGSLRDEKIIISHISFLEGVTRDIYFENTKDKYLYTNTISVPKDMRIVDITSDDVIGDIEMLKLNRYTTAHNKKDDWVSLSNLKSFTDNSFMIFRTFISDSFVPSLRIRFVSDEQISPRNINNITLEGIEKLSDEDFEKDVREGKHYLLFVNIERDSIETYSKILKQYRFWLSDIRLYPIKDNLLVRRFILTAFAHIPDVDFDVRSEEKDIFNKLLKESDPRSHNRTQDDKLNNRRFIVFLSVFFILILISLLLPGFYFKDIYLKRVIIPVSLTIILIYGLLWVRQIFEDINIWKDVNGSNTSTSNGSYKTTENGMQVVYLSGDPYQRGYQHGYLLEQEIHKTVQSLDNYFYSRRPFNKLLRPVYNYILDILFKRLYIPDDHIIELQGLSDGSKIPIRILERLHTIPVLFSAGCSGFIAYNSATSNHEMIQTRNLDWYLGVGIENQTVLFVVPPQNRIPYIHLGYAGIIGVLTGTNKNGITVTEIGSTSLSRSYSGVPMVFLYKLVMEEAGDINSAIKLINLMPRTLGYNYIIGDFREKTGVILETTAGHFRVYHVNDHELSKTIYAHPTRDILIASAPAMSEDIRYWQMCAGSDVLKPGLEFPSNSTYYHRYLEQNRLLQKDFGNITPETAQDIASASESWNGNIQSVVFTSDYMLIASAKNGVPAPLNGYKRFYLDGLFNGSPGPSE